MLLIMRIRSSISSSGMGMPLIMKKNGYRNGGEAAAEQVAKPRAKGLRRMVTRGHSLPSDLEQSTIRHTFAFWRRVHCYR